MCTNRNGIGQDCLTIPKVQADVILDGDKPALEDL